MTNKTLKIRKDKNDIYIFLKVKLIFINFLWTNWKKKNFYMLGIILRKTWYKELQLKA